MQFDRLLTMPYPERNQGYFVSLALSQRYKIWPHEPVQTELVNKVIVKKTIIHVLTVCPPKSEIGCDSIAEAAYPVAGDG